MIHNTFAGPGFEIEGILEHKLTIHRSGKIKQCVYKMFPIDPEVYEYQIEKEKMEMFFNYLVSTVQINEWAEDYSVLVLDGWSWECIITYSDKQIKKVIGTVKPPQNGNLLKKRIYKLAKFKVKPWIF